MKQIYKKLYFEEETGKYIFISDDDTRLVVSQEGYLLSYILEQLILLNKEKEVYNLNAKT